MISWKLIGSQSFNEYAVLLHTVKCLWNKTGTAAFAEVSNLMADVEANFFV